MTPLPSSELFRLLYQGQLQKIAVGLSNSTGTFNSYEQDYIRLASFCLESDLPSAAISPNVILLEALRQESLLDYKTSLKLHQQGSYADELLHTLTLLDLNLRVTPLRELHIPNLSEFYTETYVLPSISAFRLVHIIDQICTNNSLLDLPDHLRHFAIATIHNQINLQPSIDNYIYLCQLYFTLQEYEEALKYAHAALQQFGDHERIYTEVARNLYALNRLKESHKYLVRVLGTNPSNLEALVMEARNLDLYGLPTAALEKLEVALNLADRRLSLLYATANCYQRYQNIQLALHSYHKIARLIPTYHKILYRLSYSHLALYGDTKFTRTLCAQLERSNPMSSSSAIVLSEFAGVIKSEISPLAVLEDAVQRSPSCWLINRKLILDLNNSGNRLKALQYCTQFEPYVTEQSLLGFTLISAKVYLDVGLVEYVYKALDNLQNLMLSNIYADWLEWINFYGYACFIIPSVRDDPLFNSLIFSLASAKALNLVAEWLDLVFAAHQMERKQVNTRPAAKARKIGFVSPNFRGHVVSIISFDMIKEMTMLGDVEVYLIAVNYLCKDSEFLKTAKEVPNLTVAEFYKPPGGVTIEICKLGLDVLVELDGVTSDYSFPMLLAKPAVVNCTWLGFDAPYVSEDNFFLCDWYTHPAGIDELYMEKLIRLPHSHMCISGYTVADKDRQQVREELGIAADKIAFIYTAAVRKFNYETALAHARIIKAVPNSVLIVKTHLGAINRPLEMWQKEFAELGIDTDRLIVTQPTATQAEHRFYFKVADIYLDAYPYNGGSQTLEALWCELPVVTLCGQQSFARMGYSLLSTLGITDGIAYSWEEYVEWAVRLATDKDLYQKIKHRLWEAKQPETLSPLWNPKQFARDMYNILQDLYGQEMQKRQG